LLQARQAVTLTPKPGLFLVQIMDADIVCPATHGAYATFRSKLITALGVLARGAPHSRIFVVSQWGSPTTTWKALRPAQRQQFVAGDQGGGGVGPCAFIDPRGRLVLKEAGRLDTIIHGYEAQLAASCKRVPRCTYDRGAFGRQVNKNQYISEDLNHFSVNGAAAAAAAARPARKQRGVFPRWPPPARNGCPRRSTAAAAATRPATASRAAQPLVSVSVSLRPAPFTGVRPGHVRAVRGRWRTP